LHDVATSGALEQEMLVQELVPGAVEHAQAVFCRGRLVACHVYAQVMQGAGGGDAIKESVSRPIVRADLARIGERLDWHGALSVDYILRESDRAVADIAAGVPVYIDCNPRLVEPMSAALAGLDLAGMLVKVSLGESPEAVPDGRAGTRTHLGMQVLLGHALRGESRVELLAEMWRLLTRGGAYEGSVEELTPVRLDWPSAVPLMATALSLLASPRLAHALTRRGWGAHLLTPGSIRLIEEGIPVACSR
jgi:hypothetical protein